MLSSVNFSLAAIQNVENLTLTGTALRATGNGLSNILTGTSAKNDLDGGAGADRLIGKGGDDTYRLDRAGDTVVELAAQGFDTILLKTATFIDPTIPVPDPVAQFDMALDAANVEVLTIVDDVLRAVILGNASNNRITGNARDNTLSGAEGNDTLDASRGGVDVLFGGIGDDTGIFTLAGAVGPDEFHGGDGIDTLVMDWSGATNGILYLTTYYRTTVDNVGYNYVSFWDVERWQLTGGAGNDDLRGGALDDILTGGAGIDFLTGGTGQGTYRGGAGMDTVFATILTGAGADLGLDFVLDLGDARFADVVVNAGTAVETRWRGVETLQLFTGAGNDRLDARGVASSSGITGVSMVFGAAGGNDTFASDIAVFGSTEFRAGSGTDTLIMDWSGATNDILFLTTYYRTTVDNVGYNYVHFADVERWQLTGGLGNDDLRGGTLDDILVGGAGNDVLRGDLGKGAYRGGTGMDFVFARIGTEATPVPAAGFSLVLAAAQTAEVVVNAGTAFETRWFGVEGVNLTTGSGSDLLDVRGVAYASGNHMVFASGGGNDTFASDIGVFGSTQFYGGDGVDTLVMDWSGAVDNILFLTTYYRTTLTAGYNYVHFADVERWQLTGGAGNDDLRGGALDDILTGGAGIDFLTGGTGQGTYRGGAGMDTVFATILTGAGADLGLDFVLDLGDARFADVVVNAGTAVETRWRGVETLQLFTGAGNDRLDARGVASSSGITGVSMVFDAAGGNDTFASDIAVFGSTEFRAGTGTDTLIMDWSGATNDILFLTTYYRTTVDNVGYNYVHFADVERWQLTGGLGNDDLRGGTLDDILVGGAGNDVLRGDLGKGAYRGGDGHGLRLCPDRHRGDAGPGGGLLAGAGRGADRRSRRQRRHRL